jgi:alkanesulfonate monooxygenase SsuD/methylene tetrahydromethanopterin reductase-like flavin-dependent oxidoreductase (luciferase family)
VIRTPESVDWMIENDYLPLTGNPYLQPHAADLQKEATMKDMILDAQRRFGKKVTLDETWGLLHNICVADTDEDAARIFHDTWEFGNSLLNTYTKVVEKGSPLPKDYKQYWVGSTEELRSKYSYEEVLAYHGSLVGSPDTVVKKLEHLYELSGLKNHLMWMNRGGLMPQRDQLRSMELFATEVMPKVRHIGEPAPALAATGD